MSFLKDPAPGTTPLDGTTIRTDQWDYLVDFIARTYPVSATVSKSGSTYYAYQGDGTFITSNTTASTVFDAVFDFLTAGGVLFVKAATYDISTTLSPLSNTVIIGEGDATVFKAVTNLNTAIFTLTGVTDIKFMNLKIDGNRANQSGVGDDLSAVYTTNAAAARVGFVGCTIISTKGDGLHLFGDYNYVHNCYINDTNSRGVHARGKYPKVIGCIITNPQASSTGDGIQFQISGLCGGIIDDCTIINCGAAGIDLHQVTPNNIEKITVSNCYIEDPTSSYIEVDGAKNVEISHVICFWTGAAGKCSNGGFRIDTISGTAIPTMVTVSDCQIDGTRASAASGIEIVDGSRITVHDCDITNCADNGILVGGTSANINIHDNEIYNNKALAVTGYGIEVTNTVTDVRMKNNNIDLRHTADINIAATNVRIIVTGNTVRSGSAGLVFTTIGASDVVRNNVGFVTENSGTSTISGGVTTTVITHGLSYTPAINDIHVTPHGSWLAATKWWISTVTSTEFTINVDIAPGGLGLTFGWSVKR